MADPAHTSDPSLLSKMFVPTERGDMTAVQVLTPQWIVAPNMH